MFFQQQPKQRDSQTARPQSQTIELHSPLETHTGGPCSSVSQSIRRCESIAFPPMAGRLGAYGLTSCRADAQWNPLTPCQRTLNQKPTCSIPTRQVSPRKPVHPGLRIGMCWAAHPHSLTSFAGVFASKPSRGETWGN